MKLKHILVLALSLLPIASADYLDDTLINLTAIDSSIDISSPIYCINAYGTSSMWRFEYLNQSNASAASYEVMTYNFTVAGVDVKGTDLPYVSYSDNRTKTVASNVAGAINITITFDISQSPAAPSIVYNSGRRNYDGHWSVAYWNGTYGNMTLTNITIEMGDNIFMLTYSGIGASTGGASGGSAADVQNIEKAGELNITEEESFLDRLLSTEKEENGICDDGEFPLVDSDCKVSLNTLLCIGDDCLLDYMWFAKTLVLITGYIMFFRRRNLWLVLLMLAVLAFAYTPLKGIVL